MLLERKERALHTTTTIHIGTFSAKKGARKKTVVCLKYPQNEPNYYEIWQVHDIKIVLLHDYNDVPLELIDLSSKWPNKAVRQIGHCDVLVRRTCLFKGW